MFRATLNKTQLEKKSRANESGGIGILHGKKGEQHHMTSHSKVPEIKCCLRTKVPRSNTSHYSGDNCSEQFWQSIQFLTLQSAEDWFTALWSTSSINPLGNSVCLIEKAKLFQLGEKRSRKASVMTLNNLVLSIRLKCHNLYWKRMSHRKNLSLNRIH